MELHPNHAFLLDSAARLARGRILDYGCGRGEVVLAGLERGLDIFGADVFYGGGHGDREHVVENAELHNRVREIANDRVPFPDGYFSLVRHNQVFEHVPDLDKPLSEIRRVLTDDGVMLSLFPSREVLREGHCGVPLAHRFGGWPNIQYMWLLAARRCGLGYFHNSKSSPQWARDFAIWLRTWCYYRPERVIREAYRRHGFSFEAHESQYALFRLEYTGRNWATPVVRTVARLAAWSIRRLAGMVILSHVRGGAVGNLAGR